MPPGVYIAEIPRSSSARHGGKGSDLQDSELAIEPLERTHELLPAGSEFCMAKPDLGANTEFARTPTLPTRNKTQSRQFPQQPQVLSCQQRYQTQTGHESTAAHSRLIADFAKSAILSCPDLADGPPHLSMNGTVCGSKTASQTTLRSLRSPQCCP